MNAALQELVLILGDRDPYQRRRLQGHDHARLEGAAARREVHLRRAPSCPTCPPASTSTAIRKNKLGRDAGWIAQPARRSTCATARWWPWTTAPATSSPTSARPATTASPRTPKFDPKYDHVGLGKRQPGSAWKPIVYATGIDTGALTAGTRPARHHHALRRPALTAARGCPRTPTAPTAGPSSCATRCSSRSTCRPSARSHRVGVKTVRKYAVKAGFEFLPDFGNKALDVAGLAGAIGTVEVRPLDMTAAFGAFGNGGKVTRPRYILKVEGPDGEVIYEAGKPVTTQVWSPQTAYIMADILKGNTDPAENAVWADIFELRQHQGRRPAARLPSRPAPPTTSRTTPPTASCRCPRARSSRRWRWASGTATATAPPPNLTSRPDLLHGQRRRDLALPSCATT